MFGRLAYFGRLVLLGFVVALGLGGVVGSAGPAQALPAVCYLCVPPDPSLGGGQLFERMVDDAVSGDAEAGSVVNQPVADPEAPVVSAEPGAQTFFTGIPRDGEFDINEWDLWYAPDVNVFGIDTNAFFGQLSDLSFTVYKTVIHVVITFVGYLVFGLVFVLWLLQPALDLAGSFQETVVGPFELRWLVAAVLVVVIALAYWRGRYGSIISQTFLTVVILGVVLVPVDAVRYVVSLASGSAAVVLVTGSGGDPTGIAGPSSAPIDTTVSLDAYQEFTSGMEEVMIGDVAEQLTFGAFLPSECAGAYAEGRALGLPVTDEKNWDALRAIDACVPYAEAASVPSSERVFGAGFLALYSLLFALLFALIALPAIKGQVQLMLATALYPFLFLGLAVPGSFRASIFRFVANVLAGIFHLLTFSIALCLMLVGMKSVLAGSDTWIMGWRLVATLIIPLVIVLAYWQWIRNSKRSITDSARRLGWRERERGSVETSVRKGGKTLAKGAVHAAGAAVTSGASAGVSAARVAAGTAAKKSAQAVKNRVRRPDDVPVESAGPVAAPAGSSWVPTPGDPYDPTNREHEGAAKRAAEAEYERVNGPGVGLNDVLAAQVMRSGAGSPAAPSSGAAGASVALGSRGEVSGRSPAATKALADRREAARRIRMADQVGVGSPSGKRSRRRTEQPAVAATRERALADKGERIERRMAAVTPAGASPDRVVDRQGQDDAGLAQAREFVERVNAGAVPGAVIGGAKRASRVSEGAPTAWRPPEVSQSLPPRPAVGPSVGGSGGRGTGSGQ